MNDLNNSPLGWYSLEHLSENADSHLDDFHPWKWASSKVRLDFVYFNHGMMEWRVKLDGKKGHSIGTTACQKKSCCPP